MIVINKMIVKMIREVIRRVNVMANRNSRNSILLSSLLM